LDTKFGFALLKTSAEAGHSSGQFWCGKCLLERDKRALRRITIENKIFKTQLAACRADLKLIETAYETLLRMQTEFDAIVKEQTEQVELTIGN
jgi:hypothetical protein